MLCFLGAYLACRLMDHLFTNTHVRHSLSQPGINKCLATLRQKHSLQSEHCTGLIMVSYSSESEHYRSHLVCSLIRVSRSEDGSYIGDAINNPGISFVSSRYPFCLLPFFLFSSQGQGNTQESDAGNCKTHRLTQDCQAFK